MSKPKPKLKKSAPSPSSASTAPPTSAEPVQQVSEKQPDPVPPAPSITVLESDANANLQNKPREDKRPLFDFGMGKMKELAEAFQKAKQVQEGCKQIQEELEQVEVEGESGDGLVKVVLSGNQRPLRATISPKVLEEGAEVVSALVTAALKDAYTKSTAIVWKKMKELCGGLNLPGFD